LAYFIMPLLSSAKMGPAVPHTDLFAPQSTGKLAGKGAISTGVRQEHKFRFQMPPSTSYNALRNGGVKLNGQPTSGVARCAWRKAASATAKLFDNPSGGLAWVL